MELITAFIIGLAGSIHCIGMCGPIAVALPTAVSSKAAFFLGRLNYNLGRILSYALLGAVCGVVGKAVFAGEYQRTLSVVLGLLVLIAVFLPGRLTARLTGAGCQSQLFMRLKGIWKRHFSRPTAGSMFIIGLLNGILPCGLV